MEHALGIGRWLPGHYSTGIGRYGPGQVPGVFHLQPQTRHASAREIIAAAATFHQQSGVEDGIFQF